uniref:Uncharacterized protein n=3 Tax=Pygocentrus nattereri TaxID=42514 RepID=A0A3B4CNL5_PYGNA
MPAMAFIKVQPKRIALFFRRGRCISHVNNSVKTQVYNCNSTAAEPLWLAGPSLDKKPQFLMNKLHPRCRPYLKSPVSCSCISIHAYSANQPSERVKNSQPNILESKASPAVLEGQTLAMGMWSLGLGAVGAAIAGIILANTDLFLTKPEPATVEYLEDADLKTTFGDDKTFKAQTLWEKSGAVIMVVRRPG